jgi:hypothetical protein
MDQDLMRKKLGFVPDLMANVTGVTMGDDDRQGVLRAASVFVGANTSLTCFNQGVQLRADFDNQYDSNAIQVWLATERVQDGTFGGHRMAGFIPRRVCLNPECYKGFGGKNAEAMKCPFCSYDLHGDERTWLNAYIANHYFKMNRGIWYAVWWINQASHESSFGCKMALGFPRKEGP